MDNIKPDNVSGVRVRFAPSPTGFLHIGNFRSCLFNFLFARHHGGSFLLRIEDTDQQRFKQEYTDAIMDALAWVGIEIDEPVVIQSERISQHNAVINQLLKQNKVYKCFCSPEQVTERYNQQYPGDPFVRYDGLCRNKQHEDDSRPYVIRFAMPTSFINYHDQKAHVDQQGDDYIVFDDLIRGRVVVLLKQFDDFIIVRSDGTPMYNFVVVVDDAYMRITHVIRGEDHISNTPKQILLAQACGYPIPQFAHLPLILGASGEKLSKREAAVSVIEYQKTGYLPAALMNYLARLGWAHGDQEIFTLHELIQYFDLDQVSKKGAIFDIDKLNWVNAVHIRQTIAECLLEYIITYVSPELLDTLSGWDAKTLERTIDLYKERVHTLSELVTELTQCYVGPAGFNENDLVQWTDANTPHYLDVLLKDLAASDDFSIDVLKNKVKEDAKKLGIKMVDLAQPIRIALLGSSNGPGVFELLSIIGKNESIRRIAALRDVIMIR